MRNYKIFLVEKMSSLRNITKICIIKYPVESLFAFMLLSSGLYILYNYIISQFSGLEISGGIDSFFIVKLYIKELLFLICAISYGVLMLSMKSTLGFWSKINNLPIRINQVFYSYLTLYFIGFQLLIIIPLLMMLATLKANIILILSLLSIWFLIMVIYILFTLLIYQTISFYVQHYSVYFISFLISSIILSTALNCILNLDYIRSDSFFKIIIFTLFIVCVLFYFLTIKSSLNFNNMTNKSVDVERSKHKIFKHTSNKYIILICLETINNFRLYLKVIFLPFSLALGSKIVFDNSEYMNFLVIMSSISAVSIGLYFSNIYTLIVLPLNENITLLGKALLSFIILALVLLTLTYGIDLNINYTAIFLVSCLMFLLFYLIRAPIIINGEESAFFYLLVGLLPTLLSLSNVLIQYAVVDMFNIPIDENLIYALLIFAIAPIVIYRRAGKENEIL